MNLHSLRFRILVSVALSLVLLFVAISLISRLVLMQGHLNLEAEKTTFQVNSVVALLREQSVQLDGIASDWAHWDDTYEFVMRPNPRYIESNYTDDTFEHLNVNLILIVNEEGNILFEKAIDLKNGKAMAVPVEIKSAIVPDGVLAGKKHFNGLIHTSLGNFVIAAEAVLQSGGKGQRRGYLVMARLIDSDALRHVGEIVDAKVALSSTSAPDFPAAIFKDAANSARGGVVITQADASVAGYAMMRDINDKGNLFIRLSSDRSIFEQGKTSLHLLVWSSLIIAMGLLIVGWVFDKLVLARLALLSGSMQKIGASGLLSSRITNFAGKDEISSLSSEINAALDRLQNAQQSLTESEQALLYEKEHAHAALASISDAVVTADGEGRITFMNQAAEKLAGLNFEQAKGQFAHELFRLMKDDHSAPVDEKWFVDPASNQEDAILDRGDGKEYLVQKSTSQLHHGDGSSRGTVTILHDVTTLRSLTNALTHQASYDNLTGLINRYEFDRKLGEALGNSRAEKRVHCLAYMDLDQFKLVNDTCGHMAGDSLLHQLAQSLKAEIRRGDILARLGGDEFAILLPDCNIEAAQRVMNNLLKMINEFRFSYDEHVFKLGASIGLAEISPEYTGSLSDLLGAVDSACYSAKEAGGGRFRVFRPDDIEIQQRHSQMEWVSRIHQGLEQNRFVLYVQRMASLKPNKRSHCEVLIRMWGEDGKLYPPGYFLPAAERYHLMPVLDRWVVQEALSIIAKGGDNLPDVCAINLSGQILSEDDFLDFVIEQINAKQVDPKKVCFEITETSVISNIDQAKNFIRKLRAIGCQFSLDDFGSGLSSFAYLKNLDVDFLKIDGMFVKNMVNDPVSRAMVESINHIGGVMGLKTIAEFAENTEIIDLLREIGVDYAQGYGVGQPEPFV